MDNTPETIKVIYLDHFQEIYSRCTPELVQNIRNKLSVDLDEIVDNFFQAMITVKHANTYLTNKLIQDELHAVLARWIDSLFVYRSLPETEIFIEQQLSIGHAHARITLPPHLFNCGIRVLKQEVNRILRKGSISLKEYTRTSTLASMIIDLTTSLMNESFFEDTMIEERRSQSLRLHMTGSELAVKCEQLRAEIFHWHSKILNILSASPDIDEQSLPSCLHSEIGLWIIHKAPLFFPNSDYVQKLQHRVEVIDSHMKSIVTLHQADQSQSYIQALHTLAQMVNDLSNMLSSLSEHAVSLDSGRDTLTRLFNRRYLDTILQKETHYCMIHHKSYVIILIDIDFFKSINDNYGHDIGDKVLQQMAEILTHHIRAGDFVFRYGGEEFLILLADMKIEFVDNIAQTLLKAVSSHAFNIGLSTPLQCTISMGIACHQGHPDYTHVINQADKALYQAKNNGRNCYIILNE